MAGGTTKGIFVADGANTTQNLLDARDAIRGAILDCDFPMPVPKPGVGNPARIVLCKSTCDSVTADPTASLQILLGCPTETNVPK